MLCINFINKRLDFLRWILGMANFEVIVSACSISMLSVGKHLLHSRFAGLAWTSQQHVRAFLSPVFGTIVSPCLFWLPLQYRSDGIFQFNFHFPSDNLSWVFYCNPICHLVLCFGELSISNLHQDLIETFIALLFIICSESSLYI